MGLLFSSLWNRLWNTEKKFKVLIVGLSNAGKTTILYRLVTEEVVATSPTIGSNVEEVAYRNVQFVMWDLGGQDQLRKTWAQYYADTDAVVLVVDSSDEERLALVREELLRMMGDTGLARAILLVFANKQDLDGSLSVAKISDALGLHTLQGHSWHIQSSCALAGEGIYEGFDWIVEQLK